MFLVMPKTKVSTDGGNDQVRRRVIATVDKPARVQAACDRCRAKKVKCDGKDPCLRCVNDHVVCLITKHAPTDAKSAMREYISSMEDRQGRLIKALSQVQRHFAQSLDKQQFEETMRIVKACGYDLAGTEHLRLLHQVPTSSTDPEPAAYDFPLSAASEVAGAGKRKRETQAAQQVVTDSSHVMSNEEVDGNLAPGETAASEPRKKRKSITVSHTTDSTWDIPDRPTAISPDLQNPSDTAIPSASDGYAVDWLSEIPTWLLDELQPPSDGVLGLGSSPTADNEPFFRDHEDGWDSLSAFREHRGGNEGEGVLWWDPAPLFDVEIDHSGVEP